MNRLDIARAIKRECGMLGSITSTTSATGRDELCVKWGDEAWKIIQQRRNWDWLWEQSTVTISSGTSATAGTIAAARYIKEATRNASGAELTYMPWADFRDAYPTALIFAGVPSVWTVRPDKAFAVNAKPASDYVLTVERYRNPTAMAADDDTPTGIPAEHDMAIVWRAVMLYAGRDTHSALYQHAQAEYRKALSAMGVNEQPELEWGASW